MDLVGFQFDRRFVLDALARGEIDFLENVSEAAEADFFRHLMRRDVLRRLAEHYPTPRLRFHERAIVLQHPARCGQGSIVVPPAPV